MKHSTGFTRKALVMSALLVLVSIALVGTVAADDLLPCQQWGTCNATAGYYGPGGMMGGYAGYGGYGMMGPGGADMMESVEVAAMGRPAHDEMQGFVTNMMAGNLSSADQARMVEIMNTYPGGSNMMLTRRMGGYETGAGGYPGMTGNGVFYGRAGDYGTGAGRYAGMMDGYGPYSGTPGGAGLMGGGLWVLFMLFAALFAIVWLVAGILLVIWLLRQLQKDKSPS